MEIFCFRPKQFCLKTKYFTFSNLLNYFSNVAIFIYFFFKSVNKHRVNCHFYGNLLVIIGYYKQEQSQNLIVMFLTSSKFCTFFSYIDCSPIFIHMIIHSLLIFKHFKREINVDSKALYLQYYIST